MLKTLCTKINGNQKKKIKNTYEKKMTDDVEQRKKMIQKNPKVKRKTKQKKRKPKNQTLVPTLFFHPFKGLPGRSHLRLRPNFSRKTKLPQLFSFQSLFPFP